MSDERLTQHEWLGRLAQDDAFVIPCETFRAMRESLDIGSAEMMDDFIKAVMAGNMPRTDEPYATVARHIRAIMKWGEATQ